MKLYNIEKVVRGQVQVYFRDKLYTIKEPTVETYAEITMDIQKKLEEDAIQGQLWLVKKLCPDIDLVDILQAELEQISTIALHVLRGQHGGKNKTLEAAQIPE